MTNTNEGEVWGAESDVFRAAEEAFFVDDRRLSFSGRARYGQMLLAALNAATPLIEAKWRERVAELERECCEWQRSLALADNRTRKAEAQLAESAQASDRLYHISEERYESLMIALAERDQASAQLAELSEHNDELLSDIASAETRADQASAQLAGMREALTIAAEQFRHYERLHHAKGTTEGYAKAAANASFARQMEAALTPPEPIAPAPGEGDWQPIETAPKDGTHVLGYGPHERDGHYIDAIHYWPKAGRWTIEWMDQHGAPTHWMPLPSPPTPASTGQAPEGD